MMNGPLLYGAKHVKRYKTKEALKTTLGVSSSHGRRLSICSIWFYRGDMETFSNLLFTPHCAIFSNFCRQPSSLFWQWSSLIICKINIFKLSFWEGGRKTQSRGCSRGPYVQDLSSRPRPPENIHQAHTHTLSKPAWALLTRHNFQN